MSLLLENVTNKKNLPWGAANVSDVSSKAYTW